MPQVKRHISPNSARKALNFYSSDIGVKIAHVQGSDSGFYSMLDLSEQENEKIAEYYASDEGIALKAFEDQLVFDRLISDEII